MKFIIICTYSKFDLIFVSSTFSVIFALLIISQYWIDYQNFNLNIPNRWNQKLKPLS